jgi:DNA-binding LytR/AlgR family response regulator
MIYTYLILDDDSKSVLKIQSIMAEFSNFQLLATASTYDEGLNVVLTHQPDFIFLEINPLSTTSQLSLSLISELHRFLDKLPQIIAISHDLTKAVEAVKYDVLDFLVKPFTAHDIRKILFRYQKNNEGSVIRLNQDIRKAGIVQDSIEQNNQSATIEEKVSSPPPPLTANHEGFKELIDLLKTEISYLKEAILKRPIIEASTIDTTEITNQLFAVIADKFPQNSTFLLEPIIEELKEVKNQLTSQPKEGVHRNLICIKSYGDYRFLELDEIAFLKADNNSTDITMNNGDSIPAFKTLKYFEENLPDNFFRIHNSYMVNKNFVARVHTGNAVFYIKNSKTQVPFSKSYKENVESILSQLVGIDFKDI